MWGKPWVQAQFVTGLMEVMLTPLGYVRFGFPEYRLCTCIACFLGAQPRVPCQHGTQSPAGVSPGILATLFMVLVISFGSTGLPTHVCAALGPVGIQEPLPTICFVRLTKLFTVPCVPNEKAAKQKVVCS